MPDIPATLIVGLGPTGLSCVRHLAAQGVAVGVTDSRPEPPGLAALRAEWPDVPVFLGGLDPAACAAASRLIVSPGVAPRETPIAQALARGAEVIGDIELFARAVNAPVAAITGSNGKSTVTSLVGEMARASGLAVAVGGNLGPPALELLDPACHLYVLELSSFQLETTYTLRPRAAVVLNISADHLDRHPSLDAYAAIKARILQNAAIGIRNRQDPRVAAMGESTARDRTFGLDVPARENDFGLLEHQGRPWLGQGREPWLPAAEVALPGLHNLANALAALALGTACGLDRDAMREVLRRYRGLPHRTAWVAERRGVRWYDDSKGTNPGATMAALRGLIAHPDEHRAVLIAGGDGKGADFTELAEVVARTVRALVLIGRDAPRIEAAVAGRVPVYPASTLPEAVELAEGLARPGDIVLLSPACASFDMFDHYRQRGQVFTEAVRALGE